MGVAIIALVSGCGNDSGDGDGLLAAEQDELPQDLLGVSMAIRALTELAPTDGQAFVVPSDAAVLALDADSLADLATEGSLANIVDSGRLIDRVSADELRDVVVLVRRSAAPLMVETDSDGTLLIAGHPLREILVWNDTQLVVIEGVLSDGGADG